jgi:peptidoglycan/LPS O-acetylase OafA/YrhL
MYKNINVYRPEIDGLRSIAVLSVIIYHAFPNFLSGGFLGVDVFFVISGFLITGIIVDEIKNGNFSIKKFYERRLRRIIPALYSMLLIITPIVFWLFIPGEVKEFSKSIGSSLAFISNIFFYKIIGYFNSEIELKPLIHIWSLSLEEQFYVILPIFLIALSKTKRFLIGTLVLILVVSLVLADKTVIKHQSAAFYLLQTRCWELIAGALMSFVGFRMFKHFNLKNGLSAIGLGLIFTSIILFKPTKLHPSFWTVIPVFGTCLVLLCGDNETSIGKVLSNKLLVGLGLISYSLYLWHQPIFAIYRNVWSGQITFQAFSLLIVIIFSCAYLSWKYVETPFRNKEKISTSLLIKLFIFFSVFLFGLGIAGYKSNGFSKIKMTKDEMSLVKKITYYPPITNQCFNTPYEENCRKYANNATWAIIGDSHAGRVSVVLEELLQKKNINLIAFTAAGCPPALFIGEPKLSCIDKTRASLNYVINSPNIKSVVIQYRLNGLLFGKHQYVYPNLPDEYEGNIRNVRWKSLVAICEELIKANKKVILVLQPPEIPKRPEFLIMGHQGDLINIDGVSKNYQEKRSKFVINHLAELPKGIVIINPANFFCRKACLAVMDGMPLYDDLDHLNYFGAKILSEHIVSENL